MMYKWEDLKKKIQEINCTVIEKINRIVTFEEIMTDSNLPIIRYLTKKDKNKKNKKCNIWYCKRFYNSFIIK